ncbi:MAG TPA: MBL fold metallo-hydrolase [Longimicrobium sp.]|nr:MBL fold metallo-hydrolase [Longimicrobium sp.]
MQAFICTQCGTQQAETEAAPERCPVCVDERQYVNPQGQQWTTHERLRRTHRNGVRTEGPGVLGIGVEPQMAIGQRALLVRGAEGNVLWDCVPLLDEGVAEMIRGLGGLRAIAVSHPHFHASMVDWAHAFGCPVYVHAGNREWVLRPDPAVRYWEGETMALGGGMTLVRCGGHFPGSAVLHHAGDGGAILAGDTVYVNPDGRTVGMMYSFPNHVPLSAGAVRRVAGALEPFAFRRIYGAWWGAVIEDGGAEVVRRSAERHVAAIEGEYDA